MTKETYIDKLIKLERLCRKKALEGAKEIPTGHKLFLNVSPNVVHGNQFKSGFTNKYLNRYGIKAMKQHLMMWAPANQALTPFWI